MAGRRQRWMVALVVGFVALGLVSLLAGRSIASAATSVNDNVIVVIPSTTSTTTTSTTTTTTAAPYRITYNANGGSGTMAAQDFRGSTTLNANSYTRSGYTFAGWSTTAAGTVAFADKATYSTAGNVTLYAVWTIVNYSITFNANGGSGTMANLSFTVAGKALTANTFTRANYTFAGWSKTATGAVDLADKATYNTAGNVTLYAVWTAVEYTITYNANGGTGTMGAQKFTVVGEPLDANTFTRSGYSFSGWSKTATGAVAFADKATYNTAGNVTLYAVWTVNSYTVTFNANGGTGSMSAMSFTVAGKALSANTFTRANYTFAGWSKTATGAVAFADKATYNTAGNVTLYAVWTPIEYTITYNANGGTGTMAAQKFTVVGEPLDANTFTRAGYTFSGWSKTATGAVAFADKVNYNTAGNVTLYAVWTATAYTVTYNANGGTGSMSAMSFTVAGKALSANTFTRAGYTFAGWSKTATGAVEFADKATYNTAGNVTLYAVWTPVTYTVKFNANGGTGTMADMTFTVAGKALTKNVFKRTGKTFAGWATSATSTTVAYTDGATIKNAGNVTLYAIWK